MKYQKTSTGNKRYLSLMRRVFIGCTCLQPVIKNKNNKDIGEEFKFKLKKKKTIKCFKRKTTNIR